MTQSKSEAATLEPWCITETLRLRQAGLDGILVLPVPPSANATWRRRAGKSGMYLPEHVRSYKAIVARIVKATKTTKRTGPIALSVVWHRQKKQGDLSNKLKMLEDSLKGHAFEDDRYVSAIRMERVEGATRGFMSVGIYGWTPRLSVDWYTEPETA